MANLYKANQYVSTTLATAGGIDDSQTTDIELQSVTGIDTAEPGICCISYSSPIDTDNAEWVTYTSINSGTKKLEGVTRGAEDFSAKSHAYGVTVAFPISESHINNLVDALSIGGDSTDGVTTTLDEDDMASNSATSLATQQSIAAAIGGWLTAGLSGVTVTRASVDNPTVVLTFDADVTPYIWKGSRLKATENSIVHYFIVSADPTETGGVTTVTCLSEIDTTTPTQAKALLGATAISDVAYAPPKTFPSGFPISTLSWQVLTSSSSTVTQAAPAQNVWYNKLSLNIPIGDWKWLYKVIAAVNRNTTDVIVDVFSTLSTANNSESDSTTSFRAVNGRLTTSQSTVIAPLVNSGHLTLTSKSTRYLNLKTGQASISLLSSNGADAPTIIRATSTLL